MSDGTHLDAFLSYNSQDLAVVEIIYDRLKDHGCSLFFDRTNMIPGDPVRLKIDDGINKSLCFFAFLGPADEGRWQEGEISLGHARSVGRRIRFVPIILPRAVDPEEIGMIGTLSYIDLRGADPQQSELDQVILEKSIELMMRAINEERTAKGLTALQALKNLASPSPSPRPVRRPAAAPTLTPKLLPKLCDRSETCSKVRDLAPKVLGTPHVFVVPIEPAQAPGSFFSRVEHYELPDLLQLDQEAAVVAKMSMVLPRTYLPGEDYRESLRACLVETLYRKGRLGAQDHSPLTDLASEIGGLGSVTMIRINITPSTWAESGEEKARAVLAFWSAFPAIPGHRRLLVFLSIELPGPEQKPHRESMERFLNAIANSGPDSRIHLLPRIDGAIEDDFIHWAYREDVARFFEDEDDDLETEARRIYRELSDQHPGRVSLEETEARLKDLIRELTAN